MTPGNPAVGATVLRTPAIQSPNYATGTTGWIVRSDGSAEFNNITIRGATIEGSPVLTYAGTPALGNLIASSAGAAGTDEFGNAYLRGVTSYFPGVNALQTDGGTTLNLYTAPGPTGPWTPANVSLIFSTLGALELDAPLTTISGQLSATGGTPANQTLITTDTWHTLTLDAGWASLAGYAPPSYRLLPTGDLELTGLADFGSSQTTAHNLNNGHPLPAAYRPATTKRLSGYDSFGDRAYATLATSGVIQAQGDAGHPYQYLEINSVVALSV
jgi:hypothetical protein